jgi:AcrR family transcriptional regulator
MSRLEEKEKKAKRILKYALNEFKQYGYQGANTARIAKKAGVAHGTIFLHFKNKDNLLFEIIQSQLLEVSNRLYAAVRNSQSIETLCRIHLKYIEEELDFESMLARELPFFPEQLKRQIFTIRSGIIHYFYDVLVKEIEQGTIKSINPTMALNYWFGTISYFLANQEMFAPKGKIIEEKGEELIKFFLNILK